VTDNDKLPELSATSAMRNAWRFAETGDFQRARTWVMLARELREGSRQGCPRPAAHLPSEWRPPQADFERLYLDELREAVTAPAEAFAGPVKHYWPRADEGLAAFPCGIDEGFRTSDRSAVNCPGCCGVLAAREDEAPVAARHEMLPPDRCAFCGLAIRETSREVSRDGVAWSVVLVHDLNRQATCPIPTTPLHELIERFTQDAPTQTFPRTEP
jgi:hypothetical protein